jgi:hypothetical protein
MEVHGGWRKPHLLNLDEKAKEGRCPPHQEAHTVTPGKCQVTMQPKARDSFRPLPRDARSMHPRESPCFKGHVMETTFSPCSNSHPFEALTSLSQLSTTCGPFVAVQTPTQFKGAVSPHQPLPHLCHHSCPQHTPQALGLSGTIFGP